MCMCICIFFLRQTFTVDQALPELSSCADLPCEYEQVLLSK